MQTRAQDPYTALMNAPRLLACFLCELLVDERHNLVTDEPLGFYKVFNELMI